MLIALILIAPMLLAWVLYYWYEYLNGPEWASEVALGVMCIECLYLFALLTW